MSSSAEYVATTGQPAFLPDFEIHQSGVRAIRNTLKKGSGLRFG